MSGVVYSHRNEHVVNCGPTAEVKMNLTVAESNDLKQPHLSRKRKLQDVGVKENVSSSKDWKKIQFGLLAKFMGMDELEFSQWVLSATPAKREKVLQEFKLKKKTKRPNG